ncbi:carbonic anhydrase [Candidatus Dependentiae bacterium]|nr:carbonic anhydrase [Candidatus Dependentiae bacterium]
MKRIFFIAAALINLGSITTNLQAEHQAAHHSASTITPEQALELLKQGNNEFTNKEAPRLCLSITEADRQAVAGGQKPFAIIVGCSDSRVPPELVFEELGLGKLFVIRNAGNVVDDVTMGSIEYAVEHLGVPLIVVLGHQKCGAVTASVAAKLSGETVPDHIANIVEKITPSLGRVTKNTPEVVQRAVEQNALYEAKKLIRQSPVVREAVHNGTVKVVSAWYSLDDGKFNLINVK